MLVIKRFSERKKVFRERKKTGKIHAKREYDGNEIQENDKQNEVEEIEIGIWNVRGMSTFEKQNEVEKFITDENLQ
ncbi:hypothetical protein Tco_1179627, partial [Tanacetum coccineum]